MTDAATSERLILKFEKEILPLLKFAKSKPGPNQRPSPLGRTVFEAVAKLNQAKKAAGVAETFAKNTNKTFKRHFGRLAKSFSEQNL